MTAAARPTVPSDETSAARCGWCSCPLPKHAYGCPHDTVYQPVQQRDAEIAALRRERDALREALREYAVVDISSCGSCDICGIEWVRDSEQHAPGCLAAPPKEPSNG